MLEVQLQPIILRFDSLPSTNTEAGRQAVQGAPEGLCVVAREQTAGRGRQERAWVSPMDAGLYFSIVLRPRLEVAAWPLLTLMASVAVCDALAETCGLSVDIKWPNDIHARERKLCGILAETVETKTERAVIVGIGINLNQRAFPVELQEQATSIEAENSAPPDKESLLSALVQHLARRYAQLHEVDGQAEMLRAWTARSSYANGKHVRVNAGTANFEGVTRGLESDGALRVETINGELKIVRAADIFSVRATSDK